MRIFFRNLLGIWGQEEIELAEKLNIRNPHPFTTEKYLKELFMLAPNNIGQEHRYPEKYAVTEGAGLYKLPDTITLHRTRPIIIPEGQKIVSVNLSIDFAYEVPQNLVGLGCCGSYSLQRAISLANRYGGDPRCGGGIKHLFPPHKLRREAERKLSDILKANTFTGLTYLREIGGYHANCFYNGTRDNSCTIPIHVGNEISIIRDFFKFSDKDRYYGYAFTDSAFAKFEKWRTEQVSSNPDMIDCASTEPYGLKVSRAKVEIFG